MLLTQQLFIGINKPKHYGISTVDHRMVSGFKTDEKIAIVDKKRSNNKSNLSNLKYKSIMTGEMPIIPINHKFRFPSPRAKDGAIAIETIIKTKNR